MWRGTKVQAGTTPLSPLFMDGGCIWRCLNYRYGAAVDVGGGGDLVDIVNMRTGEKREGMTTKPLMRAHDMYLAKEFSIGSLMHFDALLKACAKTCLETLDLSACCMDTTSVGELARVLRLDNMARPLALTMNSTGRGPHRCDGFNKARRIVLEHERDAWARATAGLGAAAAAAARLTVTVLECRGLPTLDTSILGGSYNDVFVQLEVRPAAGQRERGRGHRHGHHGGGGESKRTAILHDGGAAPRWCTWSRACGIEDAPGVHGGRDAQFDLPAGPSPSPLFRTRITTCYPDHDRVEAGPHFVPE